LVEGTFSNFKRKVIINAIDSQKFLKNNTNLERFRNEKGNLKVDSEGWLTYTFKNSFSNKELPNQLSQQLSPDLDQKQKKSNDEPFT
jgi:hypothetical protein